jgi:hypothetical protein
LDAWFSATSLWAQVGSPPGGTAAGATTSSAGSGVIVFETALRRWYAGLTLSTPANPSGLAWLWAILLGLGALILLVTVTQGPGRMLRQLFDIPGHLRLFSAAMARIRRSGRLLAVVVGLTVVTWTFNQALTYTDPQGRDNLTALTRGRQLVPMALEQGILAGATPLRDIIGLGNMIPLLIASAVLVFQFSTDRWGSVTRVISPRASRDAAWGTLAWGATALYAVYRAIGVIYGTTDQPLTGCFGFEVAIVPLLMPIADGMLLAWVAVELRNAGLPDSDETEALDVAGAVALMPAAVLVCLLMMPGRYAATAAGLVFQYFPSLPGVIWLLGWGVIDLQAAAIVALGMVGALAWCRGTIGSVLRGYGRLLRNEGGHLIGFLIGAAILASGLASAAYLLVLSLPIQTWVLGAADSYAHYATLPVGLLTMAGLIELGERSLPMALTARVNVEDEVRVVVE